MSSLTYEEYYQQSLHDLISLWNEDVNLLSTRIAAGGRQRYEQLLRRFVSLYVQYMRIARRLAAVHDAQLQPQKRYDMRTLLDTCLGRMLELRSLLTANCGEFVKLDDTMLDMKITPEELEAPVPRYFLEDAASVLEERRRHIASLQAHYKETEAEAPVSKALVAAAAAKRGGGFVGGRKEETPMSIEAAVAILQVNERGRQARQRARFQFAICKQQKQFAERADEYKYAAGKELAALLLQRVVQAYLARKNVMKEHKKELELLGMFPSMSTKYDAERAAADVRLSERKARQKLNEASYRQKEIEMQTRLKAEQGPRTIEEMLSEVLTSMAYARMECKDDTQLTFLATEKDDSRKAPTTAYRTSSETSPQFVYSAQRLETQNTNGRVGTSTWSSAGGSGTNIAGRLTSLRGGNSQRRKGEEEEENLTAMPQSELWESLKAADERYNKVWKPRFEQTYHKEIDLDQRADETLLRQQLLEGPRGVLEDVRRIVDQLIMVEVENLKKRLEMERRGGKRKKKGNKKKKLKKPRAPKLKDPTKGVDIDTFINSAVYQNVLQLPDPDIRLEHYLGCAAVHESPLDDLLRVQKPDEVMKQKWQRILDNWDDKVGEVMQMKKDAFQILFDKYIQQASWLSDPSPAQVRLSVTEYAILPLGSQVIHDLAPSAKTLLLYGFPGTGKTQLVHAVCNHSGANLFNLSPENFETNTGIVSIIQMVFHLAKVLAPSVIYIDKVEKLFARKKKKKGPKDPLVTRGKKMKKEILRGIAGLAHTDRVMVIGTTSAPWEAEFNAMVNNFAHMIYCATPNYGSRIVVLQKLTAQHTGESDVLKPEHCHELALLTDGLTYGDMVQIIEGVLHKRRLRALAHRPLTSTDFFSSIIRFKPPSAEVQTQMKEFSLRLPLHMRRVNPFVDFPVLEKKEGATAKKKVPKKD